MSMSRAMIPNSPISLAIDRQEANVVDSGRHAAALLRYAELQAEFTVLFVELGTTT